MGLFSCVDQVVFLQVSQLGEAFVAGLTFEGPLATVNTQVDLHTRRGKQNGVSVVFSAIESIAQHKTDRFE